MDSYFDKFDQAETPTLTLCNPNKEEICSLGGAYLGGAYNIKATMRFNALSELTFNFPSSIDAGVTPIPQYDYIKNKRLVKVENYGYFIIDTCEEDEDGKVPIKVVTAKSLEEELVFKNTGAYGGTVKLWDDISPENTLLYEMLLFAPNWSVGYVDATLQTLYRTFNQTSSTTIYNFLMTTVETAFNCIFTFDTDTRKIYAYATANATTNTDIYLSFDNLIKSTKLTEMSDELVTSMSVYGGGNLDIHAVNPLGTDTIYNFDYYKTTEWMSQDLITAINAWEAAILVQQPIYAGKLTTLNNLNITLIGQEADLVGFQGEYTTLEGLQKARIEAGLVFSDITALMVAKQVQINSKQSDITSTQSQITTINSQLLAIVTELSFASNFTTLQLLELNSFMYENTYQNQNLITTDSMTPVDIQAAAQGLYDQAVQVLTRVSQPRYEFSGDVSNFIALKEFQAFTNQLELGCVVTLEKSNGTLILPVLLEMVISFDDPSTFTMTFSNRLRLDNGEFIYSDLQGQVQQTSSTVNFNSLDWSNWTTDYKDDVSTFITSALNTANNALINSANQEIVINQNGLRGKTFIPATGLYSPTQVWLTSSVLAFTDNAWQTAKLALGSISVNGTTKFGLIADFLVGHAIAGNQLTISNQNNNFILDSTGAYLNNASFTLTSANQLSKISIDPTVGISVQTKIGGTWVNQLYIDNAGNLNFTGNLSGATGTFSGAISASYGTLGGWTINGSGLYDGYGNYIYSNGNMQLGALSINGGNATFAGNIYADHLIGQITNPQIQDGAVDAASISSVNADTITTGSMSADRIYGGTIHWPGASLGVTSTGAPALYATYFGIETTTTEIGGNLYVYGNTVEMVHNLRVDGTLDANGGTTDNNVSYTYGGTTHYMHFNHGIYTGHT